MQPQLPTMAASGLVVNLRRRPVLTVFGPRALYERDYFEPRSAAKAVAAVGSADVATSSGGNVRAEGGIALGAAGSVSTSGDAQEIVGFS